MIAEHFVQSAGCRNVSCMRLFFSLVKAKIMVDVIRPYVSLPFLPFLMPRNPFYARLVGDWAFNIFHIFKSGCWTKIAQSIVRTVSIYMVYFIFRPFPMSDGPCDPMGAKKNIVNTDNDVTRPIKAGNRFSGLAFPLFHTPTQRSCGRIINKKLIEPLDFWMFHDGNMATSCFLVNRDGSQV